MGSYQSNSIPSSDRSYTESVLKSAEESVFQSPVKCPEESVFQSPVKCPEESMIQSPTESPESPISIAVSRIDPAPTDVHHKSDVTLHEVFDYLDLKETEEFGKQENGDIENGNEIEDGSENEDESGEKVVGGDDGSEVEKKGEGSNRKFQQYPVRPDAEDCAYYLKTASCKYGSSCKFNHPVRLKKQPVKEKVKDSEESTEKPGQTECKYYSKTGWCKFGKACRYNHPGGKTSVIPVLDVNFLGLPIRPGEKECPYYMRTGSCKYGANCRFNHPDPTASGGCDSPSVYGNGGSVPLQDAAAPTLTSWSSPKILNEAASFVPPMMFPPAQVFPSRIPEWNGFQAPVYLPERSVHPCPAYVMNNPLTENNVFIHHHQQILVEEFPERIGQPECTFFLKTGDCKFKSKCKYHHPKDRLPKSAPCALSEMGLPLRPDRTICTHYSRCGTCKFGPSCKFDHPVQPTSSTVAGPDPPLPLSNSATADGDVEWE